MEFSISRDQKELLAKVDKACEKLRKNEENKWDKHELNESIPGLFENIFMNYLIPEKYGGYGGCLADYLLAVERIAQEGLSPHAFFLSHDSAALTFHNHSHDEHRNTWLTKIFASGKSNVKYEKVKGGYMLNGSLNAGNALMSKAAILYADGEKGKTAFIVPTKNCIVERVKLNGLRSADIGKHAIVDHIASKDDVIHEPGLGWIVEQEHKKMAMLINAAGYVGVSQDCLNEVKKANDTHTTSIVPRNMLANHEASKLMLRYTAWLQSKANENKKLRKKANQYLQLTHDFCFRNAMKLVKYTADKIPGTRASHHAVDFMHADYIW